MDISSHPSYIENSATASVAAAKKFIHDCRAIVSDLPIHDRLIEPVVTPRFVPTCTTELLSGLGDLATENDAWIQSHMSESKDQVAWVKETRGLDDMDIFVQVSFCRCLDIPPKKKLSIHVSSIEWPTYFKDCPSPLYIPARRGISRASDFRYCHRTLSSFKRIFLFEAFPFARGAR